MDMNSNWFVRVNEDRNNLSFSKTFACADLSSECMRTLPFDFMKSLPKEDLSNKMVIIAKWGSSWEVDISKNPRFYYMEKSGWNQFVRDNALGNNEVVTFTHKGSMCFDVNIYGGDEKEIVRPSTMAASSNGIKQEQDASMEGVEFEATEKKAEESKKKKNAVEIGESSRGVNKLNVSKMKKVKRVRVKNGVPEFEITIKKSGLRQVAIPNLFKKHISNESAMFTIHHSKGRGWWEVLCLVREAQTTFTRGWSKLAREYPLKIGDKCTLQLIKKPNECVLTIFSKAKEEEITDID